MNIFMGTHEVRTKTARGVFAGYFDSEVAALSAVERLGDYTAAWATLNPLRAEALTPDTIINPAELVRTYNTAADAHIARREWLLLDFDPPRPRTQTLQTQRKQRPNGKRNSAAMNSLQWAGPCLL